MSLRDQLAADVTDVFLSDDENVQPFLKTVMHYPRGVTAAGVERSVTVYLDDESGARMSRAREEMSVRNRDGKQIVRYGAIELAIAVTTHEDDQWLIDGERWNSVADEGRDDFMKAVIITRTETRATTARRGA